MVISPIDGAISPSMQRSSVVLPQPDGPTMATISFADVEIDVAEDLKRAVMHAKLIKADARAGRCGRGRGRRAVLLAQVQQHYPPNVVAAARPIHQPIGLSHAVPASTRVAPQKG